jgi:chemotaxis protein MotA
MPTKGRRRPDLATVLGLLLAAAGIVGGLLLEGGALADILQHTAALIVLGGTVGATLVGTPMATATGAVRRLGGLFLEKQASSSEVIEQIVGYSNRARRHGLVSLETEAFELGDPFMKKALSLGVDGCDFAETRKIMELEIEQYEEHEEQYAKVFEAAGGYCPTIGIIGAVLGLIQVMKKLDNIEEVGHGIAVAFVATVYGVGLANVVFLPAAAKIKASIRREVLRRELILEGVLAIIEGLNPTLVRVKLSAYLQGINKKTAEPSPAAAEVTA